MTLKAVDAIIEILKRDGHTSADTGISTMDVVNQAHEECAGLFNHQPAQGSAASIMTNVYRNSLHVHREKVGAAYQYYYDESKTEPKVIERSNRVPATKKILVSKSKSILPKAKPVTMTPTRVVADKQDEYQIVKHLSGEPAGVVHRGVLFTTLEQLVQTLNGKMRSS